MANYSTQLKTWGDTGTEYPQGYSYLQGEQPVDAWDNFLIYHIVDDIRNLVSLTNGRIESDKGPSGDEPTTPEESHLYHDTTNNTLKLWNASVSAWEDVGGGSISLTEPLEANGYGFLNVGSIDMDGSIDVSGFDILDGADVIYDSSAGKFADADTVDGKHASELGVGASDSGAQVVGTATDLNFASNLQVSDDGDGTVTINAQVPDADLTDISEKGTQIVANAADINFTGHLNVIDDGDGSVTIDPTHNHDGRYVQNRYSDEEARDAVGNMVTGSGATTVHYDDGGNTLTISSTDTNTTYSAGNALSLSGTTFNVNEGAIDHTNLANVSPNDHHTRYADSEARNAVDGATLGSLTLTTGRSLDLSSSRRMRLPMIDFDPAGDAGDMWYRSDLD